MRLRLKPQHFNDVKAVTKVMARVHAADPTLVNRFPRPIKTVISLGGEGMHVTFDQVEDLTRAEAARILRTKYHREPSEKLVSDTKSIAGFFYGAGDTAHLFSKTGGEAFERFTWAHEAGHFFLEFYDEAVQRLSPSLFDLGEAFSFAERDPPEQMILGLDDVPSAARSSGARRRRRPIEETKADGFAAELLAPFDAMCELARNHPKADYFEMIERLRERFGLSKVAARVRLSELSDEPTGDQEILPFLEG